MSVIPYLSLIHIFLSDTIFVNYITINTTRFGGAVDPRRPVSYTHLDVYKRQPFV